MQKLRLILMVCCFAATTQMNAQITIGVKGGFTNAWANYGDIVLPEDAQIDVNGFNVSVIGYWKIKDFLQIGTEPGYIRRGAACLPGGLGWGSTPLFVADTKVYLNYTELPIISLWHLNLGDSNFEVFGKVGYGVSFLTSAFSDRISMTDPTEPKVRTYLELKQVPLNRFDHGIYSGLGFGYTFNQNKIFMNANFYTGLKDFEFFNITKSRSIDLSLGYAYTL
jgi:hypothetical protein